MPLCDIGYVKFDCRIEFVKLFGDKLVHLECSRYREVYRLWELALFESWPCPKFKPVWFIQRQMQRDELAIISSIGKRRDAGYQELFARKKRDLKKYLLIFQKGKRPWRGPGGGLPKKNWHQNNEDTGKGKFSDARKRINTFRKEPRYLTVNKTVHHRNLFQTLIS